MSGLTQLLSEQASGVYRAKAYVADVLELAREQQWRAVHLDTTETPDKAALMGAFQEAFDLPDWFGRNWDALSDALSDVVDEPGVLLAWTGSDQLDETLRRTTEELLSERGEQGRAPFLVVILGG